MVEIKGSCLCGAVNYKGEAEPLFMANCHCTDCRKSSASGHMSLLGVPKSAVAFTGEMTEYTMKGDSGATVAHHFCPTCGSQIYNNTSSNPDAVALVAANFDNPDIFSPQAIVYASGATPWDPPKEGVPAFEKMPTRG